MFNIFDTKGEELRENLTEADAYLKKVLREGNWEKVQLAEKLVEDAEYKLGRHLLYDPQDDSDF